MPSRSVRFGAAAQKREFRELLRVANALCCLHHGTRRRSIGLRTENASFEECFDLTKLFGDNCAKLSLMWSNLKRGVYEETSFALSITDRVVDYLGKELLDGFFRRP